MKKKFRQADGTEVEIEGTAEELAEYERKIREGTKPASVGRKKPVLHGAEVDGIPLTEAEMTLVRLSRLGLLPKEERQPIVQPITPMPWPVVVPDPNPPYWLGQQCGFCGQFNCKQMHIWCHDQTITGTKLTFNTSHTADAGSWIDAGVMILNAGTTSEH